jgi:FkbM family methyltransferase
MFTIPHPRTAAKQLAWLLLGSRHPSGLAKVRVLSGPARGTRMELDIRREGSYWLGNYDDWILSRINLSKLIQPGAVVWDCGAYVGYYAAVFRKIVGASGRVIVFEGSRANFERVVRLPVLNGWKNVEVHHRAVGPASTTIEFVSNLGGASGPYHLSKQYDSAEESLDIELVECSGVDELVEVQNIPAPDFIKFDLESAEEVALHNGPHVFGEKRPPVLLELHGRAALTAAGRFLDEYEYRAIDVHYIPDYAGRAVSSSAEVERWDYVPHMLLCVPPGVAFPVND